METISRHVSSRTHGYRGLRYAASSCPAPTPRPFGNPIAAVRQPPHRPARHLAANSLNNVHEHDMNIVQIMQGAGKMEPHAGRRNAGRFPVHAVVATVLLAVFVFRVFAQLLQSYAPTPALPPFAAWESGALPYPALVAAQAVIIIVSLTLIVALFRRRLRPNRTRRHHSAGCRRPLLGGLAIPPGGGLHVSCRRAPSSATTCRLTSTSFWRDWC